MEKRILHLITGLELGGAEALLIECADHGRRFGYTPLVVSMKAGGANRERLERRGIEVVELGISPRIPGLYRLPALLAALARFKPTIAQSWLYDANVYALAATRVSSNLSADRLIWGIFGTVPDQRFLSLRLSAMIRAGARWSSRPAAIVYNAEEGEADHRRKGYEARRSLVFRNFVDTDVFRPDPEARARIRAELGIGADDPVAIIAARHDPQKSWPLALEAVAQVDGLVTLAAGARTEHLPSQPSLLRLGSRFDMAALYAAADFFLLPSGYGEGTSVAMSEAMASGLPVVVTDVGDNGRFGRDAGFVVPSADRGSLVEALTTLAQDREQRLELGRRARQLAVEQFSLHSAIQPLFRLYDSISGSGS
jgi:glycosyltransferase involved in cell wall biosynthesis